MKSEDKFDFKELASSLVIVIPFWIVAIFLWRSTGDIFYLFNFLYIGAAIGVGIGVYSALPRKKKPLGRKLTLFLIGGYLVAKIFGPILFSRAWCSWACWTAMILDLLPYKHSSGRIPGKWGWLRYIHFVLSLSIVLLLWFGFGYRVESRSITELYWLLLASCWQCYLLCNWHNTGFLAQG
jgi:polyferredoxin